MAIQTMVSSDDLLRSVIISQNGSMLSGIRELIQNGVDSYNGYESSDKTIYINLEDESETDKGKFKTLVYRDYGKTFGNTTEDIINNFFVFGGSNKTAQDLGKFGIGRGQILAMIYNSDTHKLHGTHQIYSGNYKIHNIDIENLAAEVELKDHFTDGTTWIISAEDYVFDANEIQTFLFEKIYINVPINFNGTIIDRQFKGIIIENDLYTFIVDDDFESSVGGIYIYDRGIYVTMEYIVDGFAGRLITKVPLELNFARNEIIHNKVYNEIWNSCTVELAKVIAEKFSTGMSHEKKVGLLKLYLDNMDTLDCLESEPIIRLTNDKYISIDMLKNKGKFYSASKASRVADAALCAGLYVVDQYSPLANWMYNSKLKVLGVELEKLDSSEFGQQFSQNSYTIIEPTHDWQMHFIRLLEEIPLTTTVVKREYKIGVTSNNILAWTDGSIIAFNEWFAKQCIEIPKEWFYAKVIPVIAHEYCHYSSDMNSDFHGFEFFNSVCNMEQEMLGYITAHLLTKHE